MPSVSQGADSAGFQSASASQVFTALTAKYRPDSKSSRRREPREPLHTKDRLWMSQEEEQDCVSIDVSPGGLGVLCSQHISPGTRVRFGFASLDERLMVEGVVRHSFLMDGDYHHVGIEFASR